MVVDWSDEESQECRNFKVQNRCERREGSHFLRGRSQFDDLIFRRLADDVFVFLGGGDACEFGIDFVVL